MAEPQHCHFPSASAKIFKSHLMALESVTNTLDDEIHVQLDGVVLNTFKSITKSELGPLAFVLLATVVGNSADTLDPKYGNTTNAKALLEVEGELLEKLNDAWNRKEFKEIRNLSTIYSFFNASS